MLVTGVSGSIAGAVAKALLAAGYRVRGTVRDVNNQASVRRTCGRASVRASAHVWRGSAASALPPTRAARAQLPGAAAPPRVLVRAPCTVAARIHRMPPIPQVGHLSALCPGLELVAADLLSDEGWDAACAGVTYMHHIASPFPLGASRVVRSLCFLIVLRLRTHALTHALTPRRAQW